MEPNTVVSGDQLLQRHPMQTRLSAIALRYALVGKRLFAVMSIHYF